MNCDKHEGDKSTFSTYYTETEFFIKLSTILVTSIFSV